jgi:hypothetical protein
MSLRRLKPAATVYILYHVGRVSRAILVQKPHPKQPGTWNYLSAQAGMAFK